MREIINLPHVHLRGGHEVEVIFRKSILKQAKLKAILRYLPPTSGKICMDLGGDNGILSYFLRKQGGIWHSLDLDVEAIEKIVGTNVYKIENEKMPFNNDSFDMAVIIDLLEHVDNDKGLIVELAHMLKKGATLIINVPHIKKFSLIRPVRNILGLTDERHGHIRPGYTKRQLGQLLEPYFSIKKQKTYSRFFTELLDIFINLAQLKKNAGPKGILVTEEDFKKKQGLFIVYTIIYPLLWLFSKLDLTLFFTRGHSLIVSAEKN